MQDYKLTQEQLQCLKRAHRRQRNKKKAYRINAVCLLGQGWSVKDVSEALLLDTDTLRNYWDRYQSGGIPGLLKDKYVGGESHLTDVEKHQLEAHLQENVYARVKDIINYVKAEFDVSYSESGMTKLLHTLGFSYKKPKKLPGKSNKKAQEEFIKRYHEIKREKNLDDSIYFMDATHPHHQTLTNYGWIKRGEEKPIRTSLTQKKLNIQGAINIETLEVVSSFEPWLTEESTLDFLEKMRQKVPKGRIYLVSDRAPYYHTQRVKDYAESMAISMEYLPAYSPNLNPIERLWLYFQKQVLHNKYFSTFKLFEDSARKFFANIRWHKKNLEDLITDNFQTLPSG